MRSHTFGLEDLRECLESTAPVELQGMRLLKERPHFLFATQPIPREQLVEAVTEIIAYTERCAAAARQLANAAPVPLMTTTIPEFGL